MAPRKYTYVVVPHTVHGIDYNRNGRVSPGDDIVERRAYNPNTGKYDILVDFKPITPAIRKKLVKAASPPKAVPKPPQPNVSASYYRPMSAPQENNQRVVYQNVPANPPPLVIKDETSLGQHMKAGFGMGVGFTAADAMVDVVSGMFS
jgi:hypothetical protein